MLGSLLAPQLVICDRDDSSEFRIINLDRAFETEPVPAITQDCIEAETPPFMFGMVFQILKDGVGLKPPDGRGPLYFSLSWRRKPGKLRPTYVSGFRAFVLGGPGHPSPGMGEYNEFQILATDEHLDSAVYPSVIYSFGNRLIYFGLPESFESPKKAAKEVIPPAPFNAHVSTIATSPTPTPSSTQKFPLGAAWKRVLRHFPLRNKPQVYRGPVSKVDYHYFEINTAKNPLSPGPGEQPVIFTGTSQLTGRMMIQGVEAQKLREWCLVSGRMPGHGDNVDNGAYTIEKNPSSPLDVLVFR